MITQLRGRPRRAASFIAASALSVAVLAGCGDDDDSSQSAVPVEVQNVSAGPDAQKVAALYGTLHDLWAAHMQYTVSTVNAFFHEDKALQPNLDRLLANQKDLGVAVGSYFGSEAGDKLTELLTTHIKQAVPVLTAAKKNDKAALDKALGAWYANAKEIADLISSANPENWPTSATEPMLKTHIEQTTAYSVDLLKGNYAQAIKDYDAAYKHMMMLADTLAQGIVAKFPDQFTG